MKASITLEFDSPAGLYAAVDRLRGRTDVAVTQVIPPLAPEQFVGEQRHTAHGGSATASTPQEPTKPARKPRADAGKPRGPYNTAKTTGEPAASEPGTTAANSVAATTPVAPATPTTTAAPQEEPKSVAEGQHVPPAPATAATLTLDDARAALKRIKDTKGLGTPVCIALIQSFGFDRISDVPPAKYADLIQQADDKIARLGEKA